MNNEINKFSTPYLSNLESKLSQLLQPVRPDMEFVNTLKNETNSGAYNRGGIHETRV